MKLIFYKKQIKKVEVWYRMKHFIRFLKEEDGAGVVEMILIIVVLIGIVLIFKDQLTDLVNSIFKTITKQAGKV